jgi:carbon monoxide dehydrogenase subunit G
MEVNLEKRYPLDVDAVRAWAVLRDVKSTAGCMPGATITEQIDDTHYKGTVKVKVGPANAAFAGDIEVQGLDDDGRRLQLMAKGADRGGSSASMNLTAVIEAGESPGHSVLFGDAAVIVNGKFAQFGGRMMVQVSDMLLAQFADNFRAAAAALPGEETAQAAAPGAEAAGAEAVSATAEPGAIPASPGMAPAPAPAPAAAPPRKNEINGLAILWQLIKNWFAGLFGKRS